MAIKAVRIFEDLHTLAHRWTQYNSDHYHASFEEFLKTNEPGRYERLIAIFHFVEAQEAPRGDQRLPMDQGKGSLMYYQIRAHKKGKKWPVYRSQASDIKLTLLGVHTALLMKEADSVVIRRKED